MTERRRYDDKFRASAVAALTAAGYPRTIGSLKHTADAFGLQSRVLSRWFNGEQNPPPDMMHVSKLSYFEVVTSELAIRMKTMTTRQLLMTISVLLDEVK